MGSRPRIGVRGKLHGNDVFHGCGSRHSGEELAPIYTDATEGRWVPEPLQRPLYVSAAQHLVAAIEDNGLARRNRALRLTEPDLGPVAPEV